MEKTLEIRGKLKKKLEPARYEHTLGVAYTAMCLAMRYGEDLHRAELAGLLHDCAKCIPDEEKYKKCRKYQISLSQAELDNPALVHAKLGAYLAEKKYGVQDGEVLHAIQVHTTGAPDMSLLDKIVFTADYMEPRRFRAPGLDQIRKLAFTDLDECVYVILRDTVDYLKRRGGVLDPATRSAYDFYSKERNN